MTPEISREGSDPVYGWRCLLARGRQGRGNLNLALHVAPPVSGFLRRPIFLPNKNSCKDNKPTARLLGQTRLIV
jgi:hypothetical protein